MKSPLVTVFVPCAELGKRRFTQESSSVHVHYHNWQISCFDTSLSRCLCLDCDVVYFSFFFLEIQMKAEECKQPVWEHGDHPIEANKANPTQRPLLFLKDGAFPRGKTNVITYLKIKAHKWKENGLHLVQASRFQEAYNVGQVRSLHHSGIFFFLGLGIKSVQHHPITAYQRLGYLLTLTRERYEYYKMNVDIAEDHQSLEKLSTALGNKGDYKTSGLDALQQLCCRLINGGKSFTES